MLNAYTIKTRAKLFYTLSPKVVIRKLRSKVRGEGKDRFILEDVIEEQSSENKFLRSQRMINFFWRYEKIIQRHTPNWRIDFKDAKVFEIGGGPVLGFAPIAIFFGCRRYVLVEPFYNETVFEHPKVQQYFQYVHSDLSALFGERMRLVDFMRALKEKVCVYKQFLEGFDEETGFSVVFSNSVFEHVRDVSSALKKLHDLSTDDCAFMHLVNFGNHRTPKNFFSGMYTHSKEDYWKKFGDNINLLRANDILACFHQAGLKAKLIPYVTFDRLEEKPNEWWAGRYNENDLKTRVALFANTSS